MALVSKLSCVTVPLKNKILVGFSSKPERELGHQMAIDPYWVAPLEILLHKIENKTWVWGERGRGDLRGDRGGRCWSSRRCLQSPGRGEGALNFSPAQIGKHLFSHLLAAVSHNVFIILSPEVCKISTNFGQT